MLCRKCKQQEAPPVYGTLCEDCWAEILVLGGPQPASRGVYRRGRLPHDGEEESPLERLLALAEACR